MSEKIMERRAADNKYLHKDFHISMSMALDYVLKSFGEEGVSEYLTLYTDEYLSPLKQQMKDDDLQALEQYFIDIYNIEESKLVTKLSNDSLTVDVLECPGIKHIKEKGEKVSEAWEKTTSIIYTVLCEDTPYAFDLLNYDKDTGKSSFVFNRRDSI